MGWQLDAALQALQSRGPEREIGTVEAANRAWSAAVNSISRPRVSPLVAALIADVEAGIRVLRDRDGVALTDEQITERARNIVTGLVGNYEIKEAP